MEPLIPNTSSNKLLIQTIGNAFSSSEIIYYGDIDGKRLTAISPEIVDIFALLQQAENENQEIVSKIKREILEFALSGQKIEVPEDSILRRESKVRDDISIDEVYEITGGVVEYGEASQIVKNLFYLSKSQARAKEFVKIIKEITNNNPEYEEVLNYIENNGFEIEPKIITRHSNRGCRLSESVNLDVKNVELINQIKELTEEEQIEILENGGLSNVQDIMTKNFAKVQKAQKIDKEEYYAEAVISLYDWQKIGVEKIPIEEKNNLIQRLKEEHCLELYKKLEAKGIDRNDIPRILLNIVRRKNDFEITEEDTEETVKQKRLEQYDKLTEENIDELNDELSIEAVERFLGYYDIEGSEMQLRSYQQEAIDKTDEIFETKRYASVILPTGGGKSYVALGELLKHKDEKMLYLAPTNEILEQMKNIIVTYHGKKGTFGKSKDEIVAEVFPNLKFMKYPSLLSKDGREMIKEEYDFIVLDELHRTGAEKWGKRIDKLLDNQPETTRVLGITATPRRDSDGRNMSNEIAEKLGYTNEEAIRGDHIAMNLSLVNAIRMGIVVNPKLVCCEYNLKESGELDRLEERIRDISDIKVKNEKLEEYEKLRRSIEYAKEIPEILQENVKSGGKYIVFLPIVEDIEDEDGNKIGRKKGKNKIADYEKQITEYFKISWIVPQFNSMLGEYGDDKNEAQLEEFQNSQDTRFMLVMNKANEGLHIKGLDGIIWLRPLDENSRILYLQQLGRAIYAENPDSPTKDENRPVVIDLVNNTMSVDWENEITEKDDMQMMNLVLNWTERHNEMLPDINSNDREESGYAKVLKEIQGKYGKYLNGEFDELNDEQIKEIKTILEMGKQIDLWGIDLPDKEKGGRGQGSKNSGSTYIDDFKLTALMQDFVELEKEIEEIEGRTAVERFIIMIEQLTEIGIDCSKMSARDTIEELAKKSGVSREKIEEVELDPDEKIGHRKSHIASAYRGKGGYFPPTKEQVARLLELGISLELIENATDVLIRTLEQLKKLGVDCSKIVESDTIETLAQKSEISREKIEEVELDPDEKIGHKKSNIASAYRGGSNGYVKPTDEQVARLLELGISLELIEKENVTDVFIRTVEKLKELGVNCSKIVDGDTIETLAQKSGISREKIEEVGLNPDEKIGHRKNKIACAYRGKGGYFPPTKEQVARLLELGVSLELIEKENATDVLIRTLEQLKELGIDCSKIMGRDTIEKLAKKSGVSREKIEEAGLNPDEKIGYRKNNIARAYRGKGSYFPPTKEQVARLLELGISLEKKQRSSKEIAEATISSLKDETAVETYGELLEEAEIKEKTDAQTGKANPANQSSGAIDVPE